MTNIYRDSNLICPHCKTSYRPDPRLTRILQLDHYSDITFYHGTGCDRCFHSGYSGRTGIFEVMKVDEQLRDLIARQILEAELKQKAISQGMNTLKTSGIKKVLRGETTIEETLRVIL